MQQLQEQLAQYTGFTKDLEKFNKETITTDNSSRDIKNAEG